MLKKSTSWTVLLYALLLMGLAYWGYTQGSLVSLYSGMAFGFLLLLCSLLMFAEVRWSAYIALSLTVLLTALFAIRYSMTGKDLPAILAVVSGGMLLYLLAQTTHWRR
jgi:uncharacterized membrane protein (UPF0136 family)